MRKDRARIATNGTRDKKTLILDAAVELFLEDGFDRTSMDAVAERAGVSKTTVYAHYGDKVGLFRAVVDRGGSTLNVDLENMLHGAGNSPEERLAQALVALLRGTTAPPMIAYLRILVAETTRRPELARILLGSSAVPYAVEVVASILADDATLHGYTLADPTAHASLFMRMGAACMQLDAITDARFHPSPDLLENHATWVTKLFLRGLRPRPTDNEGEPAAMEPPVGYSYPWMPGAEQN
ncbi:TetR/AcrR family transcriptional regulator [Streptomyces griseorubiginosus]|uniref:TetR/AcrR family transcriptional regulator n=1 Tax=Streptomyces griseorubiginosus TaxID=67304 RepID=UPI0033F15362